MVMTLDPKAPPDARLETLAQFTATLNKDTAPILAGPFYSELGFEALYWIPFLAQLRQSVKDFDTRAIIVTRGGAGCFYRTLAAQGVDLFHLRSVTEVRRAALKQQRQTGIQKQTTVTEFDRAVLHDAAKAHGFGLPYHVVHPSLMYWACEPYFSDVAGMQYLGRLCRFEVLAAPAVPEGVTLPDKFVAVKFYARHTWPYPNGDVAEFCKYTVSTIAAQVPVVVLESSDAYDDHADIMLAGPNILSLGAKTPAVDNLAFQAAVLAKATVFIGTYGGVAQLALRMGRPSASFYHAWSGIGHAHFALNSWLSKTTKVPFLTGDLGDAHLWGQLTGLPSVPVVKALPPTPTTMTVAGSVATQTVAQEVAV